MAVTVFKIITVLFIIHTCTSAQLRPKYDQKEAISSQSYFRHDVPLSYKFTTQHDYSFEKTLDKKETAKVAPLQYAPLYLKKSHLMNEERDGHQKTRENIELRKKHLEPKMPTADAKTLEGIHGAFPYIPGHNIEILQSVNRSPGLHVEYRSNPETTSDATTKQNNRINYHRAFSVFKKPENVLNLSNHQDQSIPAQPTNEPLDQFTRIFRLATNANGDENHNVEPINQSLDQQLLRNHKTLQDIHELTKQIESQRVVGYPKMNTLLLNLARVYNARAPAFNHVNYLDHSSEKGLGNSQPVVRSPALKFSSERGRSRIGPVILTNPHLKLHTQ